MGEEKNFEKRIRTFLQSCGCYEVKYFANQFTKSGIPDVLACVNGRFVGIEVKANNGRPSPLQFYNLNLIDEAGGYAVLLYPNDFNAFKNLINCIKAGDEENVRINYDVLKRRWVDGLHRVQKVSSMQQGI